MGNFFNKKKQDSVNEDKNLVNEEYRIRKIAWVKTVKTESILEAFQGFQEDILSTQEHVLHSHKSAGKKFMISLSSTLEALQANVLKIDRNLLNDQNAEYFFEIIQRELPWAISEYQKIVFGKEIYYPMVWESFSSIFLKTPLEKLGVMRTQQATMQALLDVDPAKKEIKHFPKMSSNNQNVTASLQKVENLWSQNKTGKHSVEDEYFLEQTVTSYVPEAWRMFITFQNAPKEIQTKATEVFLKQMDLIQNQLYQILQRNMELNLSTMQAQFDFLEQKSNETENKSARDALS